MTLSIHTFIVLFLAGMFTFVYSHNDSYEECLSKVTEKGFIYKKNTAIKAFENAYMKLTFNFTGRIGRATLKEYYTELFVLGTEDFKEDTLKNPKQWCETYHRNEPDCRQELYNGGFKENTSSKAFYFAYYHCTLQYTKQRNTKTYDYYIYLWVAYQQKLVNKNIRSPKAFCSKTLENDNNEYQDEQEELDLNIDSSRANDCIINLQYGDINVFQTGFEAFEFMYYNLTTYFTHRDGREILHDYFTKTFDSVTADFEERMLLNPNPWCEVHYGKADKNCRMSLFYDGFRPKRMTSLSAFRYAYIHFSTKHLSNKSEYTHAYYSYLFEEYRQYLVNKDIKSPRDFCYNRQFVNYTGEPIDLNIENDQE